MFELEKLTENCYYIKSPVQVGVVKISDSEVVLIDGGSDKDAGRRIRQVMDQNNWKVSAIYDTHFHADHTGGNKYLQLQFDCKIYSPGKDFYFTECPLLEPTSLFGGLPFKELHHKFLMAEESVCKKLEESDLPKDMSLIDLKGHSCDMVGFMHKDGIAYIGDALSSKEILEKYRIAYIWNIQDYLDTLERLKEIDATTYISAHVVPLNREELLDLIEYNKKVTFEIIDEILDILKNETTFEDLLQALFKKYSLEMNLRQNVLVGSTVKSYLSYLKDLDKITYTFKDEKMYWITK